MEKLIEKLENLKNSLDDLDIIKEYKIINRNISKNKDLLGKIQIYKKTNDYKIRNEIITNEDFLKHQHLETEINFLILEINKKLKEINKKGKCSL